MNAYPIPVGVPTAYAQSLMFPVGEPNSAYAQYFTGRSWLASISNEQVSMANVTFEPGCINHWHIHHATRGGAARCSSAWVAAATRRPKGRSRSR